MGRRIPLTLFSFLFIFISRQHVIAHVEISLTQPPESRVSSQFPSTSPTHNMMSFDPSTLAVPPTTGRRLKMAPFQAFTDSTGGAESQAPSPDAGESEAPSSMIGRRLQMAPFEAFSDSTGGAESIAPSPDAGESEAPSPMIGRRLQMAPFQAFSDSTGGAESEAPSPVDSESEAPSPVDSETEAPSPMMIGRRLKMAPFQAFSDSTGGAEPQSPSPNAGEAEAPSPGGDDGYTLAIPPIGRRLKAVAFQDSNGGAEESQGHADGDETAEELAAQAPSGFADDSTSDEETSMDGGSDAGAPPPDAGDYALEDGGDGVEAEPPSSIDNSGSTPAVGAGNPDMPFDFDKFPGDVNPTITNGANGELKNICNKTESPDLCIAAVAPFLDPAKPVEIQKVLETSVQVNSAFAKHILALIRKLAATPGTPAAAREVLNGCQNSYKGVVTSYQSAINALGKKDLGRVNFTLNAVLEDCGDCADDFQGLDFRSPIPELAEKLIRMTKNSKAIIDETNGPKNGAKGEAPA